MSAGLLRAARGAALLFVFCVAAGCLKQALTPSDGTGLVNEGAGLVNCQQVGVDTKTSCMAQPGADEQACKAAGWDAYQACANDGGL